MFSQSLSIPTWEADLLPHVNADFHQSPLSEKDTPKQSVFPQTCFTVIEYYYNRISLNLQYVFHLFLSHFRPGVLKKAIYRKTLMKDLSHNS